MTTNKPGSVNQKLLYGCTSCYEDWTWPAGDLRIYENECWCKPCWDERRWEFPDLPSWNDLEPYTPALQAERDALTAECEQLRKDAERSKSAFCAVIEYILEEGRHKAPMDFLHYWREGDFDLLRCHWPEAPAAIYYADPLADHDAIDFAMEKEDKQ